MVWWRNLDLAELQANAILDMKLSKLQDLSEKTWQWAKRTYFGNFKIRIDIKKWKTYRKYHKRRINRNKKINLTALELPKFVDDYDDIDIEDLIPNENSSSNNNSSWL